MHKCMCVCMRVYVCLCVVYISGGSGPSAVSFASTPWAVDLCVYACVCMCVYVCGFVHTCIIPKEAKSKTPRMSYMT
jgi:hypothetical protein